MRCEPSSVKGWRQHRAHTGARARFLAYPVARVSRLRPLTAGNRPHRPKPRRGTSTGANWGPCKQLPRQRMPRMEVGHPLPPGTHMSPPLRLRRRRTHQLGQARPPHGRAEPLARRRLQGVLHLRQRSTSPRRRLSPKHGSWTKWRRGVCPSPVGGGPNHLDFASCRRPRLPSPLFPWVAWRQQSWRLTQSQLWLSIAS